MIGTKYMLETPEHRKNFAEDILKKKGKFVPHDTKPLSEELRILQRAMNNFNHIRKAIAIPLLKALPTVASYDTTATQQLLLSSFREEFRYWSYDDLLFLVSVMHTEELEKQCKEAVNAGICGPDMEKPI